MIVEVANFFGIRAQISGVDSCREIPVPIPNTAVKSAAPMILGWRRPGKVGSARLKKAPMKVGAFFTTKRGVLMGARVFSY